jgi:hypothetical protein
MTDTPLMARPLLAMVLLTFTVWLVMGRRRIRAVAGGEVSLADFAVRGGSGPPARVAQAGDHFANLLEVPVLFYVAIMTAALLGLTDTVLLVLAWAFVAVRVVHAVIHLSYNHVRHRFYAYVGGSTICWLIWLYLAVHVMTG